MIIVSKNIKHLNNSTQDYQTLENLTHDNLSFIDPSAKIYQKFKKKDGYFYRLSEKSRLKIISLKIKVSIKYFS